METDPDKSDFIIATQRSRCAENEPVVLTDEVKRFDRAFAWVYARKEWSRPSLYRRRGRAQSMTTVAAPQTSRLTKKIRSEAASSGAALVG